MEPIICIWLGILFGIILWALMIMFLITGIKFFMFNTKKIQLDLLKDEYVKLNDDYKKIQREKKKNKWG